MREGNTSNGRVTWEGCSVLLDINDGDRLVFARLSSQKLKIGNKNCSAFGTVFQVDTAPDGPCLSPEQVNVNNVEEIGDGQGNDEFRDKVNVNSADEVRDAAVNVESRDNGALVDNNTAQSLTGEDIEAMRRQGARDNEIIEALIANSATFEKKTSFSQEKYRLKKQKKYAPKIFAGRHGILSSNSDILVVDMIGGLLTGAVAERLGGTGFVCNSYFGQAPCSMDIVRIFNLSDEICKSFECLCFIILVLVSGFMIIISGFMNKFCNDVCNVESQSNDQISASASTVEISHLSENGSSDIGTDNTEPVIRKAPKAGERA